MAGFFIIFAFVLGGAALLFKQAADQIAIGTGWANDVCSTSKLFCQHPEFSLMPAAYCWSSRSASSSAAPLR